MRTFQQKSIDEDMIKGDIGKRIDEKLTPIIKNVMVSYDLPGLSIGIVKDNEVVYARGFGFKNIETRDPITTTTIFHMASISKPFVATAIMQLVEQGKIDLDALVIRYLPYFKLDGHQYKNITIQQMLSHVSGMPDVEDYEWYKSQYDEGALERYVRSLVSERLLHSPGEKYAYSNMAFECLGDVIAKVSGIPFADYEKKYILNPAGMNTSTFLKPVNLPEDWGAPHLRIVRTFVWEGYPYNRMHGPSSTLHSNILEMCNWVITNLNRGTFNRNKILDSSSYDVLWKPWAETGKAVVRQYVGLSWFLGEYRGEKNVRHSGSDIGFNTNIVMLPEKMLAVVVLCNCTPSPVTRLTEVILDIILGYDPGRIIPPASIQVCKILNEKGLAAAIEQWNLLKQNHPYEYDFSTQQLLDLGKIVMYFDRVEDAKNIALLCAEILPKQIMKVAKEAIEIYLNEHPENKAAAIMLKIIR